MEPSTAAVDDVTLRADVIGRPVASLPITSLLRLSLFWLGLTAIDSVVASVTQSRLKFDELVAPESIGSSLAIMSVLTFGFSFFIQPTVGSISATAIGTARIA